MFDKYIEVIEEQGITPKIIEEVVNEHSKKRSDMLSKYGRYVQKEEDTPIFNREFETGGENKINQKLANDWFGEVVDTKVGYLFGNPMIVQLEKAAPNYQLVLEKIEMFRKTNSFDDTKAENGKFAAMCGYDGMLAYHDKEGQERVKRIDPWEVIVIGEPTSPTYAIRYYQKWDDNWRVEFYDDLYKTVFEGKSLTENDLIEVDLVQNLFDYCPLWMIPNNSELMGDADKVFSLIDAYDRAVSDGNSEIEQFRLAYMLFIGYAPNEKDIEQMKKNGALYIPEAENGEDIRFLTKQLDPSFMDSHLDRLEANITRFAKHVNFTDEAFGGNLSGVAMKYKLFALETKAKAMERKDEAANLYMFKVIASSWRKKGIDLDYRMIDCKYNRNIVVDITAEANAASALMGVTSQRTALEQLSFITDVEAEMDRIEEEKAGSIDLDDPDLQDDEEKDNNKKDPENNGE